MSNLLRHDDIENEDFTSLAGSISSNRPRFDSLTGLTSSDLTDDEIDLLKPKVYQEIARQAKQRLYIKVHDSHHKNLQGVPIFPPSCSYGVIYLVRNPLDVAVSYAYHQGHLNFEKVVDQLNSCNHTMAGGSKAQLRQLTLGWRGHYTSWHQQKNIPVITIRYEDMLADTKSCLKKMATFLDLEEAHDDSKLERAVCSSHFDVLQDKEIKHGFTERPEKAKRFFRSGKSGDGRSMLHPSLQDKIINPNFDLMNRLGYLPAE